jgi:hypothetical protein
MLSRADFKTVDFDARDALDTLDDLVEDAESLRSRAAGFVREVVRSRVDWEGSLRERAGRPALSWAAVRTRREGGRSTTPFGCANGSVAEVENLSDVSDFKNSSITAGFVACVGAPSSIIRARLRMFWMDCSPLECSSGTAS